MTDDLDERLTELFTASSVSTELLPAGFAESVITGGRRRRTRVRATAVIAAAVTVAAVAAIALQAPQVVADHPQPTMPEPTNDGRSAAGSVATWLGTLPRVDDQHVAYVTHQALRVGSESVELRGPGISAATEIELRAPVVGGWIADVYGAPYTLAIVAPDGTVNPLGPYDHNTTGAEVSPDGRQAVIGDPAFAVIDLPSGAIVSTPPRGTHSVMWTDQGIYLMQPYAERVQRWQPGSDPTRVPFDDDLYCSGSGGAMLAATLRLASRECVGFMSISPSGDYGLTTAFIEDLDSGAITTLRNYPGGGYQDYPTPDEWHSVQWEDETHIVISMIFRRSAEAPLVTVLVRCQAETGVCERVSDRMTPRGQPQPTATYSLAP